MEEDFEDGCDGETEYMKKGWDNNVINCSIDETRAVMIADEQFDYEWAALEAGIIIGGLEIPRENVEMSSCGKWLWLTFIDAETAMAFKMRWS